jgi:hypothetical protein
MIVDGADVVSAKLVPSQAEALIEQLGFARASLSEQVSSDLSPRETLSFATVDPAWRTSTDVMVDGSAVDGISLALRHSGYGWLCFLLPHEEARALGQWLVENAKAD